MLKEIHRSKTSFCEFTDPKYHMYDIILEQETTIAIVEEGKETIGPTMIPFDRSFITPEIMQQAKENKAKRVTYDTVAEYLKANPEGMKKDVTKLTADDISDDELVYRILSYEEIPDDLERKKNHKTVVDTKVRLNFVPFKHYIIVDNELVEVGRSHSENGEFSLTCGCITNTLANMFVMLVKRYAQRANFRGYSYVDEMRGNALLQLTHMALRFNEMKSDNPFSYFTQAINHAFVGVLNNEKKQQNVRDDLLVRQGQAPSFTRQMEHDADMKQLREAYENSEGNLK